MNTTEMTFDNEVTKAQIAGILRKAKVTRYREEKGGKSVLRDVHRHTASYSGIEVTEVASHFNRNAGKAMRPRYIKIASGVFFAKWVDGYNDFVAVTPSQRSEAYATTMTALADAGFTILGIDAISGVKFAKVLN